MREASHGQRRDSALARMARPLLIAAAGFTLAVSGLLATTDLRGWPSSAVGVPAPILSATAEGSGDFRLADCVPVTVNPYVMPKGKEANGTASLRVTACRSWSSVLVASGLYWAAAAGVLSILVLRALARSRRRRSLGDSPL